MTAEQVIAQQRGHIARLQALAAKAWGINTPYSWSSEAVDVTHTYRQGADDGEAWVRQPLPTNT